MSKPLFALLFVVVSAAQGAAAPGGAEWIAHASRPGPEHAPVGQSRFDELFRSAPGDYRIPYPFDDLLLHLESMIDNGRQHGVRRVLIPRGRSLQRDAAAPEFDRFPRVVAALQGEPRDDTPAAGRVLEYRLFIAHQPFSQSLEVISYNDAAGRFEFQVVEDYRANGAMRVRQANRAMCLSCHQNAAPIFATRPWSETNFNFRVARRLAEAHPGRYESFVTALGGDADALDLLTDRANYLAAAQAIWQRGCDGVECRAAALRALLQYRLSNGSGFERGHATYRNDYIERLRQNWQANWPRGLALADSRIPDRDPFDAAHGLAGDPLALRPPHAQWQRFDEVLAGGIVNRLAGFLTRRDVERIDRYLLHASRFDTAPPRVMTSPCRLAHAGEDTRLLKCSSGMLDSAPRATLELDYRGDRVQSMHLLSLRLPGDPEILQPTTALSKHLPDGIVAELRNGAGLSMRLASGERLQSLRLRWQDADQQGDPVMELALHNDFGPLDEALQVLVGEHREGRAASLGAGPFRRNAILAELGQALGTPLSSDAQASASSATPRVESSVSGVSNFSPDDDDLYLLQAHCGQCHASDARQPPGFLAGNNVMRRVAQCAPRILARLRAWQDRANSEVIPMPPPANVDASWPQGDHYRRLLAAVERLRDNQAASGTVDSDAELDTCLAPGQPVVKPSRAG